jgi:LPS sulfotransferase NodH
LLKANNKTEIAAIISAPRSGSNYLCDLLNSHSRVSCYGELFHPDEVPVYFKKFFSRRRIFTLNDREADPSKFFNDVMKMTIKKSPKLRMVGSKLLLNDYQLNAGLEVVSSTCSKIILLSRENKLAWYSSLKIATETGVWVSDKVVMAKQKKIIFDAAEYQQYLTNQARLLSKVNDGLRRHQIEPYVLTYENLTQPKAFNDVLSYLNLPVEALKTKLLKQNTNSIIDRFDNPELVYQYAKQNHLLDWLA